VVAVAIPAERSSRRSGPGRCRDSSRPAASSSAAGVAAHAGGAEAAERWPRGRPPTAGLQQFGSLACGEPGGRITPTPAMAASWPLRTTSSGGIVAEFATYSRAKRSRGPTAWRDCFPSVRDIRLASGRRERGRCRHCDGGSSGDVKCAATARGSDGIGIVRLGQLGLGYRRPSLSRSSAIRPTTADRAGRLGPETTPAGRPTLTAPAPGWPV
jgi:hypothetical protein